MSFYDYCIQEIDEFEYLFRHALRRMDYNRSPLRLAAPDLYSELEDVAEDYCDENGLDIDDFDIEEALFEY